MLLLLLIYIQKKEYWASPSILLCNNHAVYLLLLFFLQVINDFLNKKEEFLNNVFTNPNYLEDLTGLTRLKNEFENIEVSKF